VVRLPAIRDSEVDGANASSVTKLAPMTAGTVPERAQSVGINPTIEDPPGAVTERFRTTAVQL
jgi:hypothetical protein